MHRLETEMERSTLNKWADLLFDTGKRNNLVNFRNTKMGTAEIVAPDIGMLFSGAEHSAVFEVYDPKNDEEDEDFEEESDDDDTAALPAELEKIKTEKTEEQARKEQEQKLKKKGVL